MGKRYLIKEASKLVEVEPHVLRYWEDELDMRIKRNEQGHRYYDEQDVRILQKVKALKDKGIGLKAIHELVSKMYDILENGVTSTQEQGVVVNIPEYIAQQDKNKDTGEKNERAENKEEADKNQESFDEKNRNQTNRCETNYYGTSLDRTNGEAADREGADSETMNRKKADREEGQEDFDEIETMLNSIEDDFTAELINKNPTEGRVVDFKLAQFQSMMTKIIGNSIKENIKPISQAVSAKTTEEVVRQMDVIMKEQEERGEERYRKLDLIMREIQQSRKEAAAAEAKTKKRFGFKRKK